MEEDLHKQIVEMSEEYGVELNFTSYIEQAKAVFNNQSGLFVRRVDFFKMTTKDTSASFF